MVLVTSSFLLLVVIDALVLSSDALVTGASKCESHQVDSWKIDMIDFHYLPPLPLVRPTAAWQDEEGT